MGHRPKLLSSLANPDLPIIDESGLDRLDTVHCRDLYETVEDLLGNGSIFITAQIPVIKWNGIFEDKKVAAAELDRILHNAIRIEPKGPSRRPVEYSVGKGGDPIVKCGK